MDRQRLIDSSEVQGLRGVGHRCGAAMAAAGERSESVRFGHSWDAEPATIGGSVFFSG